MNTNRILLYIVISLAFFSCSSINKDDLLAEFNNYQNTIVNGEYRTTVNHVVPNVFQYISEDDYVFKMVRKLEETKDYKLSLGSYSNISVSDIEEIDGVQYAIIRFNQKRIRDYKENDELDEDRLNSRRQVDKKMFGIAFGQDNIEYDSVEDRFIFKIENVVIAQLEADSKKWKFINVTDAGMNVINNIFPEELLTKIPENTTYKIIKEYHR